MTELLSPFSLEADELASEAVLVAGGRRARQSSPRRRRALCGGVMALADGAAFALAGVAVFLVAGAGELTLPVGAAAVALLGLHWIAGLYPGDRLHPQEILRRRAVAIGIAGLLAAALAESSDGGLAAATTIAWMMGLAAIAQAVLRGLARRALRRAGLWGTPTTFLGDPALTPVLETYFTANWQHGLIPAGGTAGVVALDHLPSPRELHELHRHYAEVLVIADLPQLRVSGLHPIDLDGVIGLRVGEPRRSGMSVLKRGLDLAVAIPAMVLAAPMMLVAALAIRIVDPGPAFYRQAREGYRGRVIRVLKLRTMYRDAEARLQELLRTDPAARAEWETHFKLRDDPRILPGIGHFLRASSFDEVPQFLNVIMGEMSVVGPRPFPDYHLAAMPQDFRMKRCSVAPGITGLWQITSRSDSDIALQRQLDEHYIDNRSFWLDLRIVLGTFAALLGRKGAY